MHVGHSTIAAWQWADCVKVLVVCQALHALNAHGLGSWQVDTVAAGVDPAGQLLVRTMAACPRPTRANPHIMKSEHLSTLLCGYRQPQAQLTHRIILDCRPEQLAEAARRLCGRQLGALGWVAQLHVAQLGQLLTCRRCNQRITQGHACARQEQAQTVWGGYGVV